MALTTSDMANPNKKSERWDREIELQKSYDLSPSEASMLTARENGMSSSEIAEMEGLNVQTVKNTLTRARKKMSGDTNMEFFITKLSQNLGDNAMLKSNLALVLSALCREMGYQVRVMNHTIHIKDVPRNVPGDKAWFTSNVERRVDMIGTRSDAMADERAKRIKAIYDTAMAEQGIKEPMFGHTVLKYYLDRYYISYDVVEQED